MTDRPIIFSAPMVRALLDGRKTQTRRVMKPQPELNEAGLWRFPPMSQTITKRNWKGFCQTDDDGLRSFILTTRHAPYAPGDRLWVREASATWDGGARDLMYRADTPDDEWADMLHDRRHGAPWRARPSIHMPRWASRLTLHVSEVRVQRLQEISEADAIAEGIIPNAGKLYRVGIDDEGDILAHSPVTAFAWLWNSLHGADAWGANPWVAAISFEVERANIDNARQETRK